MLLYFLWTVWRYFRRIVKRFQLQPGNVVTGAFTADAGVGEGGASQPTPEQLQRFTTSFEHLTIFALSPRHLRLANSALRVR